MAQNLRVEYKALQDERTARNNQIMIWNSLTFAAAAAILTVGVFNTNFASLQVVSTSSIVGTLLFLWRNQAHSLDRDIFSHYYRILELEKLLSLEFFTQTFRDYLGRQFDSQLLLRMFSRVFNIHSSEAISRMTKDDLIRIADMTKDDLIRISRKRNMFQISTRGHLFMDSLALAALIIFLFVSFALALKTPSPISIIALSYISILVIAFLDGLRSYLSFDQPLNS